MINLLFIDDDIDFLNLVTDWMKDHLTVTGVKNMEDAFVFLKANPVDVIVLEMKTPCIDGIKFLEEMIKKNINSEAIILTGHLCIQDSQKAMELGAFDFVLKPVGMEALLFKIQDAYRKKEIKDKKRN